MKLKYLVQTDEKYLFANCLNDLGAYYGVTVSGIKYKIKNKLIDMLLDTFNALPDAAVQNKDEIISNLKEQRRKKKTYVSSAAKKDPITPETPKDVKVAWRSTCAAIPMVGLYNAVKPANFTGFDEGWKDYVKCELVYEGEDSYYKISVDRREENTDPEYLAKIGKR